MYTQPPESIHGRFVERRGKLLIQLSSTSCKNSSNVSHGQEKMLAVILPGCWAIAIRTENGKGLAVGVTTAIDRDEQVAFAKTLANDLNMPISFYFDYGSVEVSPGSTPELPMQEPMPQPVLPDMIRDMGLGLRAALEVLDQWQEGQPLPLGVVLGYGLKYSSTGMLIHSYDPNADNSDA